MLKLLLHAPLVLLAVVWPLSGCGGNAAPPPVAAPSPEVVTSSAATEGATLPPASASATSASDATSAGSPSAAKSAPDASATGAMQLLERKMVGDGPPIPKNVSVREVRIDVTGSLPKEAFRNTVRRSLGIFGECYASGLARDASLKGEVLLRLVVDASGRVSETHVEPRTTLSDPTVLSCIQREVEGMALPPTGANVVRYELTFRPAGT